MVSHPSAYGLSRAETNLDGRAAANFTERNRLGGCYRGQTGVVSGIDSILVVRQLRARLAAEVFQRVAGSEGPARARRVHDRPGPRWFDDDAPIREVHGDAAMFVGGLRALLLQSLHPLAMAAVAGHSDYREDPWGRLARTSHFLAVTTFGSADDAERMIATVRAIHARVRGTAPDGRDYAASDPHLLAWVHLAEVDSFLAAYQLYGRRQLGRERRDRYIREAGQVAARLGVIDPPSDYAELRRALARYRPELTGTPEARQAARFLLLQPPMPLAARPAYGVLAAAAVGSLPAWTRWPLRLPYLPIAEATVVRLAGQTAVRTIRWAVSAGPAVPPAQAA